VNIIGSHFIDLEQILSTNVYASELLSQSKQIDGTIVLTNFQFKGKGRGVNQWESEKNRNILMSIILYPNFLLPENQCYLSITISLGIRKTIESFTSNSCTVKWPNDIFVNDKKIAGVLIQNTLGGNRIKNTIVGIGLNVNQVKFSNSLKIATSLTNECGNELDRDFVLEMLVNNLNYYYSKLINHDFKYLRESYLNDLYKKDKYLDFILPNGNKINGTIKGISDIGELIIYSQGEKMIFHQSEIKMIL